MVVARRASPLAIGFGEAEMAVGSDALALAALTRRLCYLEDGDWAVLTRDGAQIFNADNQPVERPVVLSAASGALIGKAITVISWKRKSMNSLKCWAIPWPII